MTRYGTRVRGRALRDWRGHWLLVPAMFLIVGLAGAAINAYPQLSLSRLLLEAPAATTSSAVSASFPICGGGARVTCVVDGDTFWLDGTKIRIADINTPEVSQPGCASEAALGRQATLRLADLLNGGPFQLVSIDRDEDRYGRKLRIVERNGQSIGDVLVAEGLAHHWQGYQQNWCG